MFKKSNILENLSSRLPTTQTTLCIHAPIHPFFHLFITKLKCHHLCETVYDPLLCSGGHNFPYIPETCYDSHDLLFLSLSHPIIVNYLV